MKEEEKQLLLKDLCARLPYGVICRLSKPPYGETIEPLKIGGLRNLIEEKWDVKPYLRPLSSMTEEEKEQIRDFWIDADVKTHATQLIDFYNKYHFDYRGLIEKGLALEAPSGMY